MTVIFANWGDIDSQVSQRAWSNLSCKIVEITPNCVNWESVVDDAIANEDDTLIFCGHGSTHGLFFPSYRYDTYILHENNVNLIHAKNVICIWCYASTFCEVHNLHSFSTSMFISNVNEAMENGYLSVTQDDINKVGEIFYDNVNNLLSADIPLSEWVMILGAKMNVEDPIDTFNRQGLLYI